MDFPHFSITTIFKNSAGAFYSGLRPEVFNLSIYRMHFKEKIVLFKILAKLIDNFKNSRKYV